MIPRLLPVASSSLARSASSSSSCLRHYSVRSNSSSLSFSISQRSVFPWREVVGPQTSSKNIELYKEIESKLIKAKANAERGQEKALPIDWKHYFHLIKDRRRFLQLLRAWYFETIQLHLGALASTTAVDRRTEKVNKQIDVFINEQKRVSEITEEQAVLLRARILGLEIEHAFIGDSEPNTFDLIDNIPGLKEQLNKEYENAEYNPTDTEQAVANIDAQSLRNVFEKGAKLENLLPETVPFDRIGDFNLEEEWKGLKEFERRIAGNNPNFQSILPEECPLKNEENPYESEHEEGHH